MWDGRGRRWRGTLGRGLGRRLKNRITGRRSTPLSTFAAYGFAAI
jgi:hypothetical protein